MKPSDRIETIFAAAIEVSDPDERRRLVERACGKDAGLRQRVEELLADHAAAGSFLDAPAPPVREVLAATIDRPDTPSPAVDEGPGTVIAGRYKLLERIGEGGMGIVFMAQQHQPVRRKVALKVIKAGMDTRQVVARFEAERQALALMDHPNIAKVLDGGETDAGRPYFVMELVQGVPITDYCDGQRLTTRERLGLFVDVCKAVQHAHTKGVIHRDIKPSNVLVTLSDGVPVPKVIDFGIAKAAGQELTDKTLFTQFAQLVGTPLYMSPEQAGGGADVDTRSDVYSLGVLLYELLTGMTPFDKQRLGKAAFDEVRRIIREEEPPKPSTRISSLSSEMITTVSARRKADPRKLGGLVRGELDWIVMRCLEKDRARRYETANGLATDVLRYLSNEAVQAGPPSAGYQLRKFVRRYRGPVAAAALLLLALIGGIAGTTWQAMRTRGERDQKQAALDAKSAALKAEAAARRQAMAALRSLLEQLTTERTLTESDRAFIRKILTHYEALAAVAGDTPAGRAIRAEGHLGVGALQLKLSQRDEARVSLERAITMFAALAAEMPAVPEFRDSLARGHFYLGDLADNSGHPAEALAAWGKSLAIEKQLVVEVPADRELQLRAAASHIALSRALTYLGKGDEASAECRDAVEIYDRLVAEFPVDVGFRAASAMGHSRLGDSLRLRDRQADAEAELRNATSILDGLVAEFPAAADYRYNLSATRVSLAYVLARQGRQRAAEAEWRGAIAQLDLLASKFPGDASYRRELANARNGLGLALTHLGQHAAAEAEFRRALTVKEHLVQDFADDPTYAVDMAGYYCNFARLDHVDLAEKLECYRKAIQTLAPIAARDPAMVYVRQFLRNCHAGRASVLTEVGRFAEAIVDSDRAVELSEEAERARYQELRAERRKLQQDAEAFGALKSRLGPVAREVLAAAGELARNYQEVGCPDLAVALLEDCLDAAKRAYGPDDSRTTDQTVQLAVMNYKVARFKRAIPLFEVALRRREVELGKDDQGTVQTMGNLGINLCEDGQIEKAIPLLEEALGRQRKLPADGSRRLSWLVGALADAYERTDAYAKAEPLRRELVESLGQPGMPGDEALLKLGNNLLQQKKYTAAEAILRRHLAIAERDYPDDWLTFAARSLLGAALTGQGKLDEAGPLLLDGYLRMYRRVESINPKMRLPQLARAVERIVNYYESRGDARNAGEWRVELEGRAQPQTRGVGPNNP